MYLKFKALDRADEIRRHKQLMEEKKRERRLDKGRVKMQQMEEQKIEESAKRIPPPSNKYASILEGKHETEQIYRAAIKKSKETDKRSSLKVTQNAKHEQPAKHSLFLIFRKDELLEFLEERLKQIEEAEQLKLLEQEEQRKQQEQEERLKQIEQEEQLKQQEQVEQNNME